MLIVTIEGLVWICTINGILIQLEKIQRGGELCFILQVLFFISRLNSSSTSPSTCPAPSHQLPPYLQTSQSAGWRGRVLQITVSRGVDPRGGVPDPRLHPAPLVGLLSVRAEPRARVSR